MTNEELAALVQSGERDRIGELWTQTVAFITKQAKIRKRDILSPAVDIEDLIQAGFLALVKAADTYRAEAECSFIGWLELHLRTAFNYAAGTKTEKQQRDPIHSCVSLNAPIAGDEDGKTLEDMQEDPESGAAFESVEADVYNEQLRAALETALDKIPPVQAETVRRRYFHGETQKQIGESLGVSTERARQIEDAGIQALRAPEVCKHLEAFIDEKTPYFMHVGPTEFNRTHTSAVEKIVFLRERMRKELHISSISGLEKKHDTNGTDENGTAEKVPGSGQTGRVF